VGRRQRAQQDIYPFAAVEEAEVGDQLFVRPHAQPRPPRRPLVALRQGRRDVRADRDMGDAPHAAGLAQPVLIFQIGDDRRVGVAGQAQHPPVTQRAGLGEQVGRAQIVEGSHKRRTTDPARQQMDQRRHPVRSRLVLQVDHIQPVARDPAFYNAQAGAVPATHRRPDTHAGIGAARPPPVSQHEHRMAHVGKRPRDLPGEIGHAALHRRIFAGD